MVHTLTKSLSDYNFEAKIRVKLPGEYLLEDDIISTTTDTSDMTITCASDDIKLLGNYPQEEQQSIKDAIAIIINTKIIPDIENSIRITRDLWEKVSVSPSTLTYTQNNVSYTLTKE